jgi:hypothetical protein
MRGVERWPDFSQSCAGHRRSEWQWLWLWPGQRDPSRPWAQVRTDPQGVGGGAELCWGSEGPLRWE